MRFKQIVFVSIVSFVLLPNTLHAASPESQTLSGAYRYQNDPYLIDWSLGEKPEASPSFVTTPEEEERLAYWKEKQADLWTRLPDGRFTLNASAYTAAADECGKSDGITASGLRVTEKRTLACPKNFPFGTIIRIEGMGDYRCEDRGGAIKGNRIDIYMHTKAEAFQFGRRQLVAEVVK
jgi:3D (Asp-Asp-Asp) domain-containing protein